MAILDEVKVAVRTTTSDTGITAEITEIIAAAKLDLMTGGVTNTDDTDALVKRAIILYAKANYGMANPDMEKYQKAYDRLKITMALTTTYGGE